MIAAAGICCGCHCEVTLSRSAIPRQEQYDAGFDDKSIDMTFGDTINYICTEHTIFGELCGGSGQTPQAVIRKET